MKVVEIHDLCLDLENKFPRLFLRFRDLGAESTLLSLDFGTISCSGLEEDRDPTKNTESSCLRGARKSNGDRVSSGSMSNSSLRTGVTSIRGRQRPFLFMGFEGKSLLFGSRRGPGGGRLCFGKLFKNKKGLKMRLLLFKKKRLPKRKSFAYSFISLW